MGPRRRGRVPGRRPADGQGQTGFRSITRRAKSKIVDCPFRRVCDAVAVPGCVHCRDLAFSISWLQSCRSHAAGVTEPHSRIIPFHERPDRRLLLRARGQADRQLQKALGRALRDRADVADEPRRDAAARLGQLRHRAGHGRCLCRSSELRHGGDRPRAGSAGLSGRHHRAARLAECRPVQSPGQTKPVLWRHVGQHGFDDQPLHGRSQDSQRRCLHPRRRRWQAAGPRGDRL